MDDDATGFSKRKYENRNDRLRNMGMKKKNLQKNKIIHKRAKGNKSKGK